jgi:hypothetical protein
MSWETTFDYFKEKLEGLGLQEHVEAFDQDNIPATLIDGSFWQNLRLVTGDGLTNQSQEVRIDHEVTIYFKGFRNPREAQRECLIKAQEIVASCVDHKAQVGAFKGVYFVDLSLEPLNDSLNDNIVRATIAFEIRMFLCI